MSNAFRVSIPCLFVAALGSCGGAHASRSPVPSQQSSPAASPALAKLSDLWWQHRLGEDVSLRLHAKLPIVAFDDFSDAHVDADVAVARHLRAELGRIDVAALSHEDRVTYEVLAWDAQTWSELPPLYYAFSSLVTPYTSPLNVCNEVFATHALATPAEREHYVALLTTLATYLAAFRPHLQAQVARGIVLPRAELPKVHGLLAAYGALGDRSPYAVSAERLAGVPPAEAAAFRARVDGAVAGAIAPAYQALLSFIDGDYARNAPVAVGLSQYPHGSDYYRALIRFHATLDITPEEVHRIGLESLAAIDREIDDTRRATGFTGTREEFRRFVTTDARFIAKSPDDVKDRAMAVLHRVEPKVKDYFLRVPKTPYGVRRLDPALEGGQTMGHYEQPLGNETTGYYNYNASDLPHRPIVFMAALMLHELIPGHHFQLNLQSENLALPSFRRETFSNAEVEGWATYASYLGIEMGVYDPYDRLGELDSEAFLSARLVVDTGMNAFGWSRERAAEFVKAHAFNFSDEQLESEMLRYAVDMPGQALAFRLGFREIVRLREKAQRELGARFDLRKFHDWVLGEGSLPLEVLARHIDWEIAQAKRGEAQ